MHTLPWLLSWLPALASAAPGLLVGPPDLPPTSHGSRVAFAHHEGETSLTVAHAITADTPRLGWLLPLPSTPSRPPTTASRGDLQRLEAFGAPRLGTLTCDDLIEDTYYSTPPGCTSYEPDFRDPAIGAPAVDALDVPGEWVTAGWVLQIVEDAGGLADWLEQHDLALPDEAAASLEAHVDGAPLLAASVVLDGPADGAWLSPIQVRYPDADLVVPAVPSAQAPPDLLLTAVSHRDAGALLVDGMTRVVIENECLLEQDRLAPFYTDGLDQALVSGGWTLEYTGPADRCDPCVGDGPLSFADLATMGFTGEAEEAWITRMVLRSGPGLDEVRLRPLPHAVQQVRYVAHDPSLEFAFPLCGEGFPADPGTCPGLKLPEQRGCVTGRLVPALPAILVGLLALGRRRRRLGVVAALLLAPVTHASEGSPRSAARELHVSATVLSTDRVRFEDLQRGGPHLGMPMIGLEGRLGLPFAPESPFALTGGIRGFWGNATPGEPDMPVQFTFLEPHVGLDGRWGGPKAGVPVAPTVRAGAQVAVGVLDASVWRPRATVAPLLHAGAGVFVGRGPRPVILELRGSVVPRTDGWGTSFHPSVRLPGWIHYAGSANVEVLVGTSFR